MKKSILLALLLTTLGCHSRQAVPGDPVQSDIYRRWQGQRSYYALIEIIDAHLTPGANQVSKRAVLKFLGPPNWGTINQDTNRVWAYQGLGRHIPQQNKALFRFDTNDILTGVEWISE
jgi:hypothetical protein